MHKARQFMAENSAYKRGSPDAIGKAKFEFSAKEPALEDRCELHTARRDFESHCLQVNCSSKVLCVCPKMARVPYDDQVAVWRTTVWI